MKIGHDFSGYEKNHALNRYWNILNFFFFMPEGKYFIHVSRLENHAQ